MKNWLFGLLIVLVLFFIIKGKIEEFQGKSYSEKIVEKIINHINNPSEQTSQELYSYLDTTVVSKDKFDEFINDVTSFHENGYTHLGLFRRVFDTKGRYFTFSQFGLPNHYEDPDGFSHSGRRDVEVILKCQQQESQIVVLIITFCDYKKNSKICGGSFSYKE